MSPEEVQRMVQEKTGIPAHRQSVMVHPSSSFDQNGQWQLFVFFADRNLTFTFTQEPQVCEILELLCSLV